MFSLVLFLLAQADPRYLSGAPPHPMNEVGPVDERASVAACTVETLRARTSCVMDGRATPATDRAGQARANVRLARETGGALCGLHADETENPGASLQLCLRRVERAAKACTLDGAEPLLDAEGNFSRRAQRCYAELAAAAQLTLAPAEAEPSKAPEAPTKRPKTGGPELL